mmetsp:Transcript_72486/g.201011  ORF Transcript_72486/g.201011 Transcript_72486/m.201011 type:complete len:221 (+) Transcript_72486:357-1019(+)
MRIWLKRRPHTSASPMHRPLNTPTGVWLGLRPTVKSHAATLSSEPCGASARRARRGDRICNRHHCCNPSCVRTRKACTSPRGGPSSPPSAARRSRVPAPGALATSATTARRRALAPLLAEAERQVPAQRQGPTRQEGRASAQTPLTNALVQRQPRSQWAPPKSVGSLPESPRRRWTTSFQTLAAACRLRRSKQACSRGKNAPLAPERSPPTTRACQQERR